MAMETVLYIPYIIFKLIINEENVYYYQTLISLTKRSRPGWQHGVFHS